MSKRIELTPKERGELVLKLISQEATAKQLAREAGVSMATLYRWRDTFLEGGMSGLKTRPEIDEENRRFKRELAQRDRLIGEMKIAMRVLEKCSNVPNER